MPAVRPVASRFAAAAAVTATLIVAGCSGLFEARYHQPPLPVPDIWPITEVSSDGAAADIGWADFFVDPRLRGLISLALTNNRDLRVAILNVEKAGLAYQIQRAALLPDVQGRGSFTRQRISPVQLGLPAGSNGGHTSKFFSAGVGIPSFELDLFGHFASLSHAALERYTAQSEARRATQLSLIAAVATAYLTLAADAEHEQLGKETLESQQASYALTEQRHALGAASALELSQARTTVETARADVARYAGVVAVDKNALNLLVGTTADPALLPDGIDIGVSGLAPLPAGLPSAVLLRRPDILEAEHALRAADATIGAARAAFFPTITLTGNVGSTSTELSGLFKSGTGTWSFAPQLTLPIFAIGTLRANLHSVQADRNIAVAHYELAIQTGFREVADALALTDALEQQRAAQQTLAEATEQAYHLSDARYKAGKDSYLALLDAQRSHYAARQSLISIRLADESNRVTLYKVLGGGWR